MGTQSMHIIIPIESKTTKENKTVDTPVLHDTGAGGNFMNKNYAKWNNIILYPLNKPIIVRATAELDFNQNLAGGPKFNIL